MMMHKFIWELHLVSWLLIFMSAIAFTQYVMKSMSKDEKRKAISYLAIFGILGILASGGLKARYHMYNKMGAYSSQKSWQHMPMMQGGSNMPMMNNR